MQTLVQMRIINTIKCYLIRAIFQSLMQCIHEIATFVVGKIGLKTKLLSKHLFHCISVKSTLVLHFEANWTIVFEFSVRVNFGAFSFLFRNNNNSSWISTLLLFIMYRWFSIVLVYIWVVIPCNLATFSQKENPEPIGFNSGNVFHNVLGERSYVDHVVTSRLDVSPFWLRSYRLLRDTIRRY